VSLLVLRNPQTGILHLCDFQYHGVQRVANMLHIGYFQPFPGAYHLGDKVKGTFRRTPDSSIMAYARVEAVLEALESRRQSELRHVIGGRSPSAGSKLFPRSPGNSERSR
jgi:hypothetical protein